MIHARPVDMPKASKRKAKRTVRLTLVFTAEEDANMEKAAAQSLQPKSTWAYRHLVFVARKQLGLPLPDFEALK